MNPYCEPVDQNLIRADDAGVLRRAGGQAFIDADRNSLKAASAKVQYQLGRETRRACELATTDEEKRLLSRSNYDGRCLWTAIYHIQASRLVARGPISSLDLLNNAGRHLVSLHCLKAIDRSNPDFKLRVAANENPPRISARSGLCWLDLIQSWAWDHAEIFLRRLPSWITTDLTDIDGLEVLKESLRFALPHTMEDPQHYVREDWFQELRKLKTKDGDNGQQYLLGDRDHSRVYIELVELAGFYDRKNLLTHATVDDAPENKPFAPDGIRWNGELHLGLTKKQFALLACLWDHQTPASLPDVREAVWGDRNGRQTIENVRKHYRAVNEFFENSRIPLEIIPLNGVLTLKRIGIDGSEAQS